MFKSLTEMEQFIGRMIDKLDASRTDSFELEVGDIKIKLDRHGEHPCCVPPAPMTTPIQIQAPTTVATAPNAASAPDAENVKAAPAAVTVNAPLLGVAYAAPSPDAEPFVTVGKHIKKGDIVCIIEAMKVMNEIEADRDGEVAEILFENGKMVEFGQPLVALK